MIPVAEPNLTGKEQEYVADAIASGHVGPDGPYVERFEEMVAKAAGREWAVATTTGTMALYAAAKALNFGGKAVAVPRVCFPAAANMFHLLGCPIGRYVGIQINHDCQFYIGTKYDFMQTPALADRAPAIGEPPECASLECYSFAANKIVTCGHGGAVVGDVPDLREEVREAITQRLSDEGGNNGRMANLNAAVGCAQMERLDEFKEIKRGIWDTYAQSGITMVDRGESRWMSTMAVEELSNDAAPKLKAAGVQTRIEYSKDEYLALSLPCSTNLTEEDQDKVIKCVSSL